MNLFSAMVTLFLVMDPLGNIPIFLPLLQNMNNRRQKMILLRESLIALIIIFFFLFFGNHILGILQISRSALGVGGGVLLLVIALKMIFPPASGIFGQSPAGEPFIVPIAVPLIAGPSAIVTVILLASFDPTRWKEWSVALIGAWMASTIILLLSTSLQRIFGRRGLMAVERLMGMILMTVAVQMFLTGISEFLAA